MTIPKTLGQIWIGPYPRPARWMKTWKDKHPEWEYTIYDNSFLHNFEFRTQRQIDELLKRGSYNGVADLMRYEILYNFGGFIPETDSICLKNTSELFVESKAYTVYENEFLRGKLVSPIMACQPGNKFLKILIEKLSATEPSQIRTPWKDTGNLFCALMIDEYEPDIEIFPSDFFNPIHHLGIQKNPGNDPYAIQLWGSTKKRYGSVGLIYSLQERLKKHYRKKAERKAEKSNTSALSDWDHILKEYS